MNALTVASRLVHFAAVTLLFGGPLFRVTVARVVLGADALVRFDRVLWRICRFAALLAAASALGWFAGVAVDMTGSWTELGQPDTIGAVAFDTQFGRVWSTRLGLIVATVGILTLRRDDIGRAGRAIVLTLAGMVAASLIGVGHAATGPGSLRFAHLVADALHIGCAAAWLGGLAGLLLLMQVDSPALVAALPRFSRMATVAVAVLLVTGVVNAALLISGFAALFDTAYGRLLLAKLVLVLVMLAFATFNRLVLSPAIRAGKAGSAATLAWSAGAELSVGMGVLASVAVLGTVHPLH